MWQQSGDRAWSMRSMVDLHGQFYWRVRVRNNLQVKSTVENILYEATTEKSGNIFYVSIHPSLVVHNLLPYPIICKLEVRVLLLLFFYLGTYNPEGNKKNWKVNTELGTIISLCSL